MSPVAAAVSHALSGLLDPERGRVGPPGDPAGLAGWAESLTVLGSVGFGDVVLRLDAAHRVLADWEGGAGPAARARLSSTSRAWTDHGHRFGELARVVLWYSRVLAQAQQLGKRAAALADQGVVEHERWLMQQQVAATGFGAPAAAEDPGMAWWRAASKLWTTARWRTADAEEALVRALRAAVEALPTRASILDDGWGAAQRWWDRFVGSGQDTLVTAAVADPSRWWLDHDRYVPDLAQLASAGAQGVGDTLGHPIDSVQQAWGTLALDPAGATGGSTFDLISGGSALLAGRFVWPMTGALTAMGTGLARSAGAGMKNLAEWLYEPGRDLGVLSARRRFGLLGAAWPDTRQWVLPPGPRAPWADPDLFRIDPSTGLAHRSSVDQVMQAWGDRLFLGEGADTMIDKLRMIPPATMELLAAHARADDWPALAGLSGSVGHVVPPGRLAEIMAMRGSEGLYLGGDVWPDVLKDCPTVLEGSNRTIRGWSDYEHRLIAANREDAVLHEAGHSVHALYVRSPGGLDPEFHGVDVVNETWPEPARLESDPWPGIASSLHADVYWGKGPNSYLKYMSGITTPGSGSTVLRHSTFASESFAEGMAWYWGRDHSAGPASFESVPKAPAVLWDYFHNYVPERLARTRFPGK